MLVDNATKTADVTGNERDKIYWGEKTKEYGMKKMADDATLKFWKIVVRRERRIQKRLRQMSNASKKI